MNDIADVDNWEGKVIKIYVYKFPEQILNKLKSKWFVEMAAKNLSAIWSFKLFNEVNFSFLSNKFFICYPSLSCKISPDFIQLVRGPPGLSTKQSLATTVKENCQSNLAEVKWPKMLRQLQAIENNNCFASNWQNLWILKSRTVP